MINVLKSEIAMIFVISFYQVSAKELKQLFMGLLPSWNLFQSWLKRSDWGTIYVELSKETEIPFKKQHRCIFI